MPDHMHGILILKEYVPVGVQYIEPRQENLEPRQDQNTHLNQYQKIIPGSLSSIVGTRHAVSQREKISSQGGEEFGRPFGGSLSTIIRSFKSAASKQIHSEGFSHFAWQSQFYEHIIRDRNDYVRIQKYISDNVAKWAQDAAKAQAFS